VGRDVAGVAVGDTVVGHVPFAAPFAAGTLGEYVVLPESQVVAVPASVDPLVAAALPLAGGAAWILADAIDAQPGHVVLINGASGGVGRMATQLLAQQGVTVVATASPATTQRMYDLGAATVIDYTQGDVAKQVLAAYPDGVDALINLNGWALETVPVDAVRRGGTIRTVTQVPDDTALEERGLTGRQVMASPDGAILAELLQQVAAGVLHIDIDRVVPLERAPAALHDIEAGQVHGKVVVDLTV
jgi:NADPH:quinone reductase-like Zn-dependent oxidoreductase